jgi:hypothetical protein
MGRKGRSGGASDMSRHVFLGVADWDRPEWQEAFYPSGLPDEWRLAYYCTRFTCVWLSYAQWSGLRPEEVELLVADSPDTFRVLLQAPHESEAVGSRVREVFQPKLGLMCSAEHPALLWFDAETDLRNLAARLHQRAELPENIYLISRDGNLDRLEQVNTLLQLLGL